MGPKFKKGDRVKCINAFTELVGSVGTITGEGRASKQIDDYIDDYIYPVEFISDIYYCYEHELKPLKKKLMVYYKEEVA